jgi:hypothetical protein
MDNMQPAMTPNGTSIWQRENGPTYQIHRDDGPAVENTRLGIAHFWLNDIRLPLDEYLVRTTGLTDEEKVMMKLQYG